MKITRFEDIEAWSEARTLVKSIYQSTKSKTFAGDESLQRQMRRASSSIMANIAEGFDGGTDPEFIRFLRIARRSATELQSHLYLALDLQYLDKGQFDQHYAHALKVKKLIGGFIRYLGGGKSST